MVCSFKRVRDAEQISIIQTITDSDAQEITRIEELSYDLRIYEVMNREVFSLHPTQTMRDVVNLLRIRRISGAPVVEDGALVGTNTARPSYLPIPRPE